MGKVAILVGNHDVGIYCAERLIERHVDRVGFVAGLASSGNIYHGCRRADVPYIPYGDEDEIVELIKKHNVTTLILGWWPHIVKKVNKLGINVINLHNSYLPYNRGKHPYYWAIRDGTTYGVTIHRVDDGVDTGSILWQHEIMILPTDTGESIYKASCFEMKMLFLEHLEDIAMERFPPGIKQSEKKATFHLAREFFENETLKLGEPLSLDLINDLRARTFNNNMSGRKIEIDGKIYRIHLKLVGDVNEESVSE